jgi:hypothetical protein
VSLVHRRVVVLWSKTNEGETPPTAGDLSQGSHNIVAGSIIRQSIRQNSLAFQPQKTYPVSTCRLAGFQPPDDTSVQLNKRPSKTDLCNRKCSLKTLSQPKDPVRFLAVIRPSWLQGWTGMAKCSEMYAGLKAVLSASTPFQLMMFPSFTKKNTANNIRGVLHRKTATS